MPKYNVLSTLNHDGKPYEAGDTVTMTEEQADILQAVNVVGELAAEVENTGEELKLKAKK